MTYNFDTLAVHAGQVPDKHFGAGATPVYLTTSFVCRNFDHAAELFNRERSGHLSSDISNPTNAVLEERIAALEGGVGAIAVASGQAALHLAITTLMSAGGHIVASRSLYSRAYSLLAHTLPRFGIQTTFVDPCDINAWRTAIRSETRMLFGETLGVSGYEVLDIPNVSAVAHEHGLPLMVDSTLTTPWLMRPFDHGADLIIHSATALLGGHGAAIGGVVVDGGSFDWGKSCKFPNLTEPYKGFHGIDFSEESTVASFLIRARNEGLHDFGACMSPLTAFQLLQGVETLSLRMERHISNTRAVVAHLIKSDGVESVGYPELDGHPDHALSQKLLPRGAGSVFCFTLKGGRSAGRKYIDALRVFSHLANVGDVRSAVIHPASTTHLRMSDTELITAGIYPGTIRLSIGLEDTDDLIEDIDRGLAAAARV